MENRQSEFKGLESQTEAIFSEPLRRLRQNLFGTFTAILARLGISADMLSIASIIPAIGFCLLARFQFSLALWLLLASLVCDGLDGVLARQTKTNSMEGAFTDTCCDLCVLALWVAGLVWRGTLNPVLAIFFVYTSTTIGIFFLLHHLFKVSTRWLLRPGKSFFCLALGLDFFFHTNLLNYLLAIYLLTLPFLGISFWRLKHAVKPVSTYEKAEKAEKIETAQ
jgi:phosphatidylglycerophosphate synthase